MRKYTAKECSCWNDYPNPMHKKSNGQWKCVDCYKMVRKGDYTRKTKCVLAEKDGDAE